MTFINVFVSYIWRKCPSYACVEAPLSFVHRVHSIFYFVIAIHFDSYPTRQISMKRPSNFYWDFQIKVNNLFAVNFYLTHQNYELLHFFYKFKGLSTHGEWFVNEYSANTQRKKNLRWRLLDEEFFNINLNFSCETHFSNFLGFWPSFRKKLKLYNIKVKKFIASKY